MLPADGRAEIRALRPRSPPAAASATEIRHRLPDAPSSTRSPRQLERSACRASGMPSVSASCASKRAPPTSPDRRSEEACPRRRCRQASSFSRGVKRQAASNNSTAVSNAPRKQPDRRPPRPSPRCIRPPRSRSAGDARSSVSVTISASRPCSCRRRQTQISTPLRQAGWVKRLDRARSAAPGCFGFENSLKRIALAR